MLEAIQEEHGQLPSADMIKLVDKLIGATLVVGEDTELLSGSEVDLIITAMLRLDGTQTVSAMTRGRIRYKLLVDLMQGGRFAMETLKHDWTLLFKVFNQQYFRVRMVKKSAVNQKRRKEQKEN